jgi:hypothetical protein
MSEGLFLFTPLDAPADLRAETVGVPISPLDEVRVLRPGTEVEAAEGETGELAARGPYTIPGYLAAPDRDCEALTAEGFYRSGDLVRARRYEGTLSYSIEGPHQGPHRPRRREDQRRRGGAPGRAAPRRCRDGPGRHARPQARRARLHLPTSCPGTRSTRRHSPASARTWRLRAWPSTSGPNVSNSSTRCRAPRSGRSKVALRADSGAKLEHETTPRRSALTA